MWSRTLVIGMAVIAALAFSQAAQAQNYSSKFFGGHSDNPVGPTVSPYLNLVNQSGNISNVTNFQSLVKPLIEQHSALNSQAGSINQLQRQLGSSAARGGGRGTGHSSYFMNGSHFYPRGIH